MAAPNVAKSSCDHVHSSAEEFRTVYPCSGTGAALCFTQQSMRSIINRCHRKNLCALAVTKHQHVRVNLFSCAASTVTAGQSVAAAILEDGVDLPHGGGRIAFETFESNVLFVLRFMIDCGVVGGCWVSAPAGKYEVGGKGDRGMLSTCQIDIHLNYRCVPLQLASGESMIACGPTNPCAAAERARSACCRCPQSHLLPVQPRDIVRESCLHVNT